VKVFSNPWTNSNYNNWVKNIGDIYEQSIDLNRIDFYSTANLIDMKNSIITGIGLNPSTTFASRYASIFSNYSWANVNGNNCSVPFTYFYQKLYSVTTIWCPMISNALNKITINYPLYPNNIAASFPYHIMFAYAFSDSYG
jgi:hypothetical protein